MWRIWLSFLVLVVSPLVFPASAFARSGVTTDALRLRSAMWGPTVDIVDPDTEIEIHARSWASDGTMWYYVSNSNGDTGWMFSDFIRTEPIYAHTVGLQVGHWRRQEAPPPFNTASGASGGGMTEAEVNMITAQSTARLLSARGVRVDILPTVIPKGYKADAVVAIHADGGPADRRGFFVDRPVRSAVAGLEAQLSKEIVGEYKANVGIPFIYRGTPNSKYYYGYYSVAPSTPMVLIETGFLSNATDRSILVNQSDETGAAISEGIMKFLNSR